MPTQLQGVQTRTVSIADLQVRASESTSAPVVSGYAALYNVLSEPLWELGGAREMIAAGAFRNALDRSDDVRLLLNHDPNYLLARTSSGTLALLEDEKGLHFSAELGDQSYARDLAISMKRGDINQNSFAFTIDDQVWETIGGEKVSVVRNLHLSDVSVVVYPAYTQTMSQIRSVQAFLAALKNAEGINTSDFAVSGDQPKRDFAVDGARRNRELQILILEN